jgi:hypothetical protein
LKNYQKEIEMQDNPQDILSNYLSVLEKRENFGMAMPLSMLSHTKNEIKEAIKAAIPELEDVEERDKLKKGYITLSEFIPDEILERVNKDWKDVADAECEAGQEPERVVEADIMAEVIRVQKSIADEGAQFSQEIAEFIRKIS